MPHGSGSARTPQRPESKKKRTQEIDIDATRYDQEPVKKKLVEI
jgi:hypothetical protein